MIEEFNVNVTLSCLFGPGLSELVLFNTYKDYEGVLRDREIMRPEVEGYMVTPIDEHAVIEYQTGVETTDDFAKMYPPNPENIKYWFQCLDVWIGLSDAAKYRVIRIDKKTAERGFSSLRRFREHVTYVTSFKVRVFGL